MRHRVGATKRCMVVTLAAILLGVIGGWAQAQTAILITLDEQPARPPTPAEATRQKLATKGLVKGERWSLDMEFEGAPRIEALKFVCEAAGNKPREIAIIIDRPAIKDAGVDLDAQITLHAKDVSVEEALKLVLHDDLSYAIQDDGAVLVSSRARLNADLPRRCYEISQVLEALRSTAGGSGEMEVSGGHRLMDLIQRTVHGAEPWESAGGRCCLDFAPEETMIVLAPDEMQRQIVSLCRDLLTVAKLRKESVRARLAETEKLLAALRQELGQQKQTLRELYVKAGRDDSRLTPQAIFAEADKAAPGQPKPEQLLALADQIEDAKVQEYDLQMRVDALRRLVQSLWEQVNDIPPTETPVWHPAEQWPGAGQHEEPAKSQVEAPTGEAAAAATSCNEFACDLYALRSKGEDNVFFSPYSISTALAMTYAGARGQTEIQMAKVLHLDLPQERLHPAFRNLMALVAAADNAKQGCQLSVANALWGQQGYEFKNDFLDLTSANYGAGFQAVDFKGATEAARQAINAWTERQTRGKIKDIVSPGSLDHRARLVLTNAIYFKGRWNVQFEKSETRNEPFTLQSGKKVDAPMMHLTDQFNYMKGESFQALWLPYAGLDLMMIVVLPDAPNGLPQLERLLTAKNLGEWQARASTKRVELSLPSFKMTRTADLADTLKSMGMADAFSSPPADFSGMTGSKDLFISAVLHKAFVEVNEEGTEAAAATATNMVLGPPEKPKPVIVFRADHPFIFLIRHNASDSILFMGRVMNPVE